MSAKGVGHEIPLEQSNYLDRINCNFISNYKAVAKAKMSTENLKQSKKDLKTKVLLHQLLCFDANVHLQVYNILVSHKKIGKRL